VHGAIGADCGSHTSVDSHGAIESSNQWVTSRPGCDTVGSALGSTGSRSVYVTSLPEPCCPEMYRMEGSSWPM